MFTRPTGYIVQNGTKQIGPTLTHANESRVSVVQQRLRVDLLRPVEASLLLGGKHETGKVCIKASPTVNNFTFL